MVIRVEAKQNTSQALNISSQASVPTGLRFAWLELTHACNLRCAQCYTHSSPKTPHRSLPTARWLSLIDELKACGATQLQFTGGEATAHPDWRLLVARAAERRLSVELFSNATTLQAPALDLLCETETSVATSLHASRAELHDAITGVPGSFEAVTETIARLCDRGLRVRVNAVLMQENAEEAPAIQALIRSLGVLTPLKADPVRPTGRGRQQLAKGELTACNGCDREGRGEAYARHHAATGNVAQPTCWDGKIAIGPLGEVSPCIFSRQQIVGNVARRPLGAVLQETLLGELWSLTVDDVEDCQACDRKAGCFDCRALPLTQVGDLRAKNPRCDYVPPLTQGANLPLAQAAAEGVDYARAPGLRALDCAGEALILDPALGQVHRLNESAARALASLGAGGSVASLAAEIALETGFDAPAIESDYQRIAAELRQTGLLVLAGQGGGGEARRSSALHPRPPPSPSLPSGSGQATGQAAREGPIAVRVRLPHPTLRFTLEAAAPAWALLQPWLGDLVLEAPGPADHHLEIRSRRPSARSPWRHYLLLDGNAEGDLISGEGLCALVETLWCGLASEADPATGSPVFHAGLLGGAAGGVLVPGRSGAGKSLLCGHALEHGARYGSDEQVSWIPEGEGLATQGLLGLQKPLGVKAEGVGFLPEAIQARLWPRPRGGGSCAAWFAPSRRLDAGEGLPLLAILLVDPSKARQAKRVSAAEGALHLLQSTFDLALLPQARLESLMQQLEQADCYRLGSADLPWAGAWVASLLRTGEAKLA